MNKEFELTAISAQEVSETLLISENYNNILWFWLVKKNRLKQRSLDLVKIYETSFCLKHFEIWYHYVI